MRNPPKAFETSGPRCFGLLTQGVSVFAFRPILTHSEDWCQKTCTKSQDKSSKKKDGKKVMDIHLGGNLLSLRQMKSIFKPRRLVTERSLLLKQHGWPKTLSTRSRTTASWVLIRLPTQCPRRIADKSGFRRGRRATKWHTTVWNLVHNQDLSEVFSDYSTPLI